MDGEDQEKRSREIADTIRRYLVAIHTGGIGITFGVVGALASNKINPGWAAWPIAIFSMGLVVVGGSLSLAKYKAIQRRDALRQNKEAPNFTACLWRNDTWDRVSLIIFLLGVLVGICKLNGINLQ